MPSLSEVQDAFRKAVMEGRPEACVAMIDPDGLSPLARIAVYRNNTLGALVSALRLTYPAVLALVGDNFFDGVASRFALLDPPASAQLTHWGEGFADYLRTFPGCGHLPWLPDVAILEWAVGQALYALETGEATSADRMANLPMAAFLWPHPSLSCLRLDSPAEAIRSAALRGGDGLERIDPNAGPVHLAVVRQADSIAIRRLDASAWRLLDRLRKGEPMGSAGMDLMPDERLGLLRDFIAHGYFSAWSLSAIELEGSQ